MAISVIQEALDGSNGERIIFVFSNNLTFKQKETFVRRVTARCEDQIHSTSWQANNRLRIEVKRKSIVDCARIDVSRAVRAVAKNVQVRT